MFSSTPPAAAVFTSMSELFSINFLSPFNFPQKRRMVIQSAEKHTQSLVNVCLAWSHRHSASILYFSDACAQCSCRQFFFLSVIMPDSPHPLKSYRKRKKKKQKTKIYTSEWNETEKKTRTQTQSHLLWCLYFRQFRWAHVHIRARVQPESICIYERILYCSMNHHRTITKP